MLQKASKEVGTPSMANTGGSAELTTVGVPAELIRMDKN
jgi:hypothetical protein